VIGHLDGQGSDAPPARLKRTSPGAIRSGSIRRPLDGRRTDRQVWRLRAYEVPLA